MRYIAFFKLCIKLQHAELKPFFQLIMVVFIFIELLPGLRFIAQAPNKFMGLSGTTGSQVPEFPSTEGGTYRPAGVLVSKSL